MLIKNLLDTIPQVGRIEAIIIRPEKRSDPLKAESVNMSIEHGIQGDHYSKEGGTRMVTLIQQEHLAAVANLIRVAAIDPLLTRRNLVVSGINLLALHNRKIQIGEDVILEGTGYCHPCSRMEINLGEGGYNAMRGHGGITARIIKGGAVNHGDDVKIIVT